MPRHRTQVAAACISALHGKHQTTTRGMSLGGCGDDRMESGELAHAVKSEANQYMIQGSEARSWSRQADDERDYSMRVRLQAWSAIVLDTMIPGSRMASALLKVCNSRSRAWA